MEEEKDSCESEMVDSSEPKSSNTKVHWTQHAKELGFPQIAQEVYQDCLKRPLQEVGRLATTPLQIVNLLLEPFRGVVFAYDEQKEKYLSSLNEKLKDVPLERIEPPPIEIVGPVLDAIRYTGEHDHLRELFTNLLASSIDSETVSDVHPAFVGVIQSLTPLDAELLAFIAKKRPTRVGLGYKRKVRSTEQIKKEHISPPKENEFVRKIDEHLLKVMLSHNEVQKAFANFSPEPIVSCPISEGFDNVVSIGLQLLSEYPDLEGKNIVSTKALNNLLRLKIFDISYNPASEEELEKLNKSKGSRQEAITANLLITEFGEDFIKTCVLDHPTDISTS